MKIILIIQDLLCHHHGNFTHFSTILQIVQDKIVIFSSSGEEEQGDPVLQVTIMIDFFTLAVIID